MYDGVQDLVLTASSRRRLTSLVDLVDRAPVDLAQVGDDVTAEVEVIIGSWGCTMLDGPVLERMPRLGLVVHAAGSVRPVVTDALWARNIVVCSAAHANAVPVAEFTFAAIVMVAKDVFRVRDRHREMRGRGHVNGIGPAGPVGTNGLRIGIVGASRIGRLVMGRLASLDVSVAVADPYLSVTEADALGVIPMSNTELFEWADIVSLHAPLLASTERMVGSALLGSMREGAWLINTARGALVDTTALERECASGRICAFIDTAEPEPFPPDSQLYGLPNVVLTPHIAGSLGNEISRMGDLALDEIERWRAGRPLAHQVHRTDMGTIA